MSGTSSGGNITAIKLKQKDPDHFKKIGAKGGKAGTGHRFAHGKVDPHKAGKIGGAISRRKHA